MSDDLDSDHARWGAAALCIGYNELVKQAKTLGEKVYFRTCRNLAEEEFVKRGGNRFVRTAGETVLKLDQPMLAVEFEARDIELMRKAVSTFDARQGSQ